MDDVELLLVGLDSVSGDSWMLASSSGVNLSPRHARSQVPALMDLGGILRDEDHIYSHASCTSASPRRTQEPGGG